MVISGTYLNQVRKIKAGKNTNICIKSDLAKSSPNRLCKSLRAERNCSRLVETMSTIVVVVGYIAGVLLYLLFIAQWFAIISIKIKRSKKNYSSVPVVALFLMWIAIPSTNISFWYWFVPGILDAGTLSLIVLPFYLIRQ